MNPRKKPEKIIVVGAGVSGATAANELAERLNIDPMNITVLESRDEVGGKLKTHHHPDNPKLVTEYGAGVLVHNYPVIDQFKKHGIALEKLLPTDYETVDIYNDIHHRSLLGKLSYVIDFAWQNVKFAHGVWTYNRAVDRLDPKPPPDQEMSLQDYFAKHHLDKVATFLKFLWPGFGYGPYHDPNNYAFKGFGYMGYTTMISIMAGNLVAVHGGYQQLVEKMLQGFDVQTSASIQKITRDETGVKVDYRKDNKDFHLEADMLVLACSPYFWNELGMELTPDEQACVDQLSYYPYPVAVCSVKGMDPKQLFFLDALEEKGYGHAAFDFTRDNRKQFDETGDGRLCTIYINLPEGKTDYDLTPGSPYYEQLKEDLKNIPGVTDVKIDSTYIWPDYNPSVPWGTGINLQRDELNHHLNTLHIGAYLPGSFETVGAVSEYAIKAVDKWLGIKKSSLQTAAEHLRRTFEFFMLPRQKPIDDNAFKETEQVTLSRR